MSVENGVTTTKPGICDNQSTPTPEITASPSPTLEPTKSPSPTPEATITPAPEPTPI